MTTLDDLDALIGQIREHGSFAFNAQATGVLPMRADLVGIELAARAGFDPRAAVNVWNKMSTVSSGQPPQMKQVVTARTSSGV